MAEHVNQCPACQDFLEELARLDTAGLGDAERAAAAAELAHHWSVVGDHTRALGRSIAAARAAAEVYGFAEAHHHYERALSLWARTPNAHGQTGLTLPHLQLEAAEAARW